MLVGSLNFTGVNVFIFYHINKMAIQDGNLVGLARHMLLSWLPMHMTLKMLLDNSKACMFQEVFSEPLKSSSYLYLP